MRLMAEARQAAEEQVHVLEEALGSVTELADQIAEGGDAYPAGVRELCRRLSEDASARRQTLEAILQQHGVIRRR